MTLYSFFIHLAFVLMLASCSWFITFRVLALNILDIPNERSSHTCPTPRGGGLGIVVAFFIGILMIYIFADQTQIDQRYFWSFLISTILIALISMYDDIKGYSFKIKLATQLVAVCLVVITGIVLDQVALPWVGNFELGFFAVFVTSFWLVGLTNVYNFMDGVDGMAVTTALIVSLFFAWITFLEGSHFIYLVSLVVVAGSLGFLPWNIPPARIFMGDIGSTFLGFTFACMAIIAARYDMSHTSFLVMPLLLFHYLFDTSFTLIRRLIAKEVITEAHRGHIYQLICQMGWSHGKVTALYALLAVVQGLSAIYLISIQGGYRWFVFLPFVFTYFITAWVIVSKARQKGILPLPS